ncbi:MAG: Holliday junction branch migration protein RuvA [Lachnospiraceae bacterium]|nr:Holliday junction branch migration protein RuvA [Lachnospiraceae bacterium]
MIAFVKGVFEDCSGGSIIVDNNGIGYEILVSEHTVSQLPAIGSQIKLYTHFNVREDAMQLFGFLEKSDLQMFQLLITVNGIGPKGALGILSAMSANELRFAIYAQDAKTISKAPGIGKKTAEKMILELKDKVNLQDTISLVESKQEETELLSNAKVETIEALEALGYSRSESVKAIQKVPDAKHMNTEELLKASLKHLVR